MERVGARERQIIGGLDRKPCLSVIVRMFTEKK